MAKRQVPKVPGSDSAGSKSRWKLIIVMVIALLAVIAASVAATWFFLANKTVAEQAAGSEHATEVAAPVRQVAIYQVLTPAFVVNFKQDGRQRYLQVSVALMGRDQVAMDALKEHLPLLRNRLVMLFSSQDFATLMTPVGKEMLRQQATAGIQEQAQKALGKPVVEQVLFTNFVLQ
ncbi:flagellar basal body-associated protein FliL [Azomonas macrocytogenes]|uniref:Flagellar protein FliL n=1 Tax=Azomonas macrocytogenes TaxID=69962 RepID=A0A839T271_AZOMA|nr:flagellar basal body-associated protein FliL [Azomonas macrocytogenes]MBB3101833.1 flagellar FliL protein [Azomonas macrocytogenes]